MAHFDLPASQQQLLADYGQRLASWPFTPATHRSYRTAFQHFLRHVAPRLPATLTRQEVADYLAGREAAGISASYHNLLINALKFYYEQLAGQPWQFSAIARPAHRARPPQVLSRDAVKTLLQTTRNPKHHLLLLLAYGLGLRVSELRHLRLHHIDSQHRLLRVPGTNGRKDRSLALSAALWHPLSEYLERASPGAYVFEGQRVGRPCHERGLQLIVQQAAARAGIGQRVTLLTLRHSYATHLLEAGTDIRLVQQLLGHLSRRSTDLYTQVARPDWPASPLDNLGL